MLNSYQHSVLLQQEIRENLRIRVRKGKEISKEKPHIFT